MFHCQAKHILVENLVAVGQDEGLVVAELVDSSSEGTEPEESASEMVVRRKMIMD